MIARLGMVPASPDGSVRPDQGIAIARRLGCDVAYVYVNWATAIANPSGVDALMGALGAGGRVAVNLGLVHSTVLGALPPPWTSLANRSIANAFASFALRFAQTYRPAYLFVGNEANIYLRTRPQAEVDAYVQAVRLTALVCRNLVPETRVGVVLAMGDGTLGDVEKQLADAAPLIGWTCYGNTPDFRFDSLERGVRLLNAVPRILPGKPFAVVETGWNTAPSLGSDEEGQALYLRAVIDFLAHSDAEFVSWFCLADARDATQAAASFFPPGATVDMAALDRFRCFLQFFGLLRADGTPKPAAQVLGQS